MKGVYIATEDALSEAVAERLILEENYGLTIVGRLGRKGNDYLMQKLPSLTKLACSIPVLLLTDLDRSECPAALIQK